MYSVYPLSRHLVSPEVNLLISPNFSANSDTRFLRYIKLHLFYYSEISPNKNLWDKELHRMSNSPYYLIFRHIRYRTPSPRGLLFLEVAIHTIQQARLPLLPLSCIPSSILSFRLSSKRPGRPRFRDSARGAYVLNSWDTRASRHSRWLFFESFHVPNVLSRR